jgi:hypothetical protein
MKTEPIITDMGIIERCKSAISFDSMEQVWNTLTLYGSVDFDIINNMKNNLNLKEIKFTLYFNDVIFYNCYDFEFYPDLGILKSSFDIINSSRLIKKITGTNKSIYSHFVIVTDDYVYEIISADYILELNSKEDNLEKYYNEENWKKFSGEYKNYHSNNTERLGEKLNIDMELVKVIDNIIGETAVEWINKKIPELNNMKPIECIRNTKLRNRLKEMLMRM